MFKKIIANLPFNPGLLDDVSFYAKKLKRDERLRSFGFIFLALAFVVQLIAALYPAQNSLASSPNDVLNGITGKGSILSAWDSNTGNIRAIYGKFGITRANIANIPGTAPNATVVSTGANYWSIGRQPLSSFGLSSSKWGERTITTSGPTIYERPLHAWDTHGSSSYKAFHGKNQYGVDFWILQNCGNPTFIGAYLPSPPKPKLEVHKTLLSGASAQPGDTVKFRLEYRNTVPDSLATNFKLSDDLNPQLELVSMGDLNGHSGNQLFIKRELLGYSSSSSTSLLTAKVRSTATNGMVICNLATVDSVETAVVNSEKPCLTVVVNAPKPPPTTPPPTTPPPTTPPPQTPPSGYCIATTKFATGSNRDFVIGTAAYVTGDTKITGYTYDIDANGSIDYTDKVAETPHQRTVTGFGNGRHKINVYVQLAGSGGQTAQTAGCPTEIAIAEDARVVLAKTVKNATQNISDASGTTVKGGDILEFKLTTENVTDTDYLNYRGEDYFGSILRYADLTNTSQLDDQDITLGKDNYLRWSTAKLKARTSEVKVLSIKIKSPIPATNAPSSLSPDYNCKISNAYGNQITMNVDCPLAKTVSTATTSLPNTGPGLTVSIAAIVAVVAGYLFARSRMMAHELAIVRQSYITTGGM